MKPLFLHPLFTLGLLIRLALIAGLAPLAMVAHRPDSKTVMAQLQGWFDDYNSYHPHSALGYLPPTLFRENQSVT
jgi:hypothetical protein